jgi:DNA-binding transcriptional LysR family regulator
MAGAVKLAKRARPGQHRRMAASPSHHHIGEHAGVELGGSAMLELRHLRAFVAVAEELHFTRAAKRLHLAQQALSTQIKQLEDAVGAQLFRRTTRVVELTPAGETLLAHAPRILDLVNEAWSATRKVIAGEREQLRIAYTPTVGSETLPLLLEEMHDRIPTIRVSRHEFWLHEAVHGVLSGQFDVALVRCPSPVDGLEIRLLRTEPLAVTLGVGHRLTRRDVLHPDELAESVLAIWPRDYSPRFFDLVAEAFPRNFEAGRVYEFENFSREGFVGDTVARMEIAAGRAFSVRIGVDQRPPEGFVFRALDPAPEIGLHLVHRSDRLTPPMTGLLKVAADVAAAEDWLPGSTRPLPRVA